MSYENFSYYYDSLMDQSFYDDYLAFILEHANFQNVLELGCGTGEIAIRLAKLQKEVYASDLSKDMLEVARLKCIENEVNIHLSRIDMCDFEIAHQLDLVLCLCDSINYILKETDVYRVFQNVFCAIKKSGCFIFDVNSLYKMEVILKDYIEKNDDPDYFFEWKVDHLDYGSVKHTVEIIDKIENDRVYEEHFQKTLSVDQYMSMLIQIGFQDIEIYSDFNNYKENCERVIFVCRKGEEK